MGAATLTGCAQTSRVEDTITPAKLATAKRAVAVMRLGAAMDSCRNARIGLATRRGEGYMVVASVTVLNLHALHVSQVAEIELDPGEYHVIGYACVAQDQSQTLVSDPSATRIVGGGQLFKTSFAHFTLEAGEIVNVGYFHFRSTFDQKTVFGKPIRTDVEITDWPLAEIERFAKMRPTIYAQMKTRLMIAGTDAHTADQQSRECETWARLKAEGKAQEAPAACGGKTPKRASTRATF